MVRSIRCLLVVLLLSAWSVGAEAQGATPAPSTKYNEPSAEMVLYTIYPSLASISGVRLHLAATDAEEWIKPRLGPPLWNPRDVKNYSITVGGETSAGSDNKHRVCGKRAP